MTYRAYSDLAEHALDSIALIAPNSARMYQIMAQHQVNEGDIAQAIIQYRKALQIDPKLSGAHFELGEAILQDFLTESPGSGLRRSSRRMLRNNSDP
jgi:cytochrome c-type biogenesis protein CcmH/NrfG